MRILGDLYLVGGGTSTAFGLTPDPDCHIYLIDAGEELVLIDCGTGDDASFSSILRNITNEGLELSRLTTLLLTHYHIDHAGGAFRFRQEFGTRIIAPKAAVAALENADEAAVGLKVAKQAGLYPPDYRMQRVEIDQAVGDGDVVTVGTTTFEVIETPGHCDGHVSYLLDFHNVRHLFAGDAVFQGGKLVLQNIHDCSIPKSAQTIRRLSAVEFDTLLPGHGGIVLSEGRRHVEIAQQAFDTLYMPKNLI